MRIHTVTERQRERNASASTGVTGNTGGESTVTTTGRRDEDSAAGAMIKEVGHY